jgi:NAD(P)-dependent dehydrogenase (short-subunit alcohol dehydrogenase family)
MSTNTPFAELSLGISGRVAIVTGAGGAIGRATAELLARHGAQVVCADLTEQSAARTCEALPEPKRHLARGYDLARADNCRALVKDTYERYRRIDILANVAAVLNRMDFLSVTEEEFERTYAAIIKSQFFLCQAVIPHMRAAKWGRIINISSGLISIFGAVHYAVAKGGVMPLTQSLAKLYGADNICINAIRPGQIDTPMLRGGLREGDIEKYVRDIPLGRLGSPPDIAHGVLYLASEWGSFVSGSELTIAGGDLLRP